MKSRVFSSKLWKNNIVGGVWLPVLLGIGFFFAFPVAALMQMGNWTARGYLPEQLLFLSRNLLTDGLVETGGFIIILAAFLNAVLGYFYLYSRDQVDFYHSLPVNRTHMFLQKLYMGLVYTMIPYLITVLLTLIVFIIRGYFEVSFLALALEMLFWHFLTYLFLYFCFVLIFSMTGTILMGLLSTFGFFLYGPALNFVLAGYTSEFINNTTHASSEFLDSVQEFTPITIIRNLCWDAPANAGSLIAAVFFTILLGVFSYLAYVRRPSEATGKSIIYTWFGVLLKFAVVIPCGLTMGLVMYSLQPNAREFWGIFGLIAGTLLTKGLMEILYTFDFRSFLKYKVQTLLSFAAVFAVVSFFIFDPLHVAEYIPSYEKLAGINFETYDEHTSVMYLKLNEKEEASQFYHMSKEAMLTKNGTELGEKTYEVLKEIITESKEEHTSLNGSYHTVTYRLKSGGYVNRYYYISDELLQKLYTVLYEETNFREMQLSVLELDPEKYLSYIYGTFCDRKDYTMFANNFKKQADLIEAYKADFMEATPEELTHQNAIAVLSFRYEDIPTQFNKDHMLPGFRPETTSCYLSSYVYPSFKRTTALLKETGFPLALEELEPTEASILIEIRDADVKKHSYSYESYGPFQITDKKDLNEIYASVHSFVPAWIPGLNEVTVFIKTHETENELIFTITNDKIPACIQELLDKVHAGEVEETIYEKGY